MLTRVPKIERSKGPLALALLFLFIGCAQRAPMRNIADPAEFARNLFRIADEGTDAEWATQLTAERRAMGDAYVEKHFERWRASLLELKQAFGVPVDQVSFRLAEENGLEFETDDKWHLIFRVAEEDGGLKINQD